MMYIMNISICSQLYVTYLKFNLFYTFPAVLMTWIKSFHSFFFIFFIEHYRQQSQLKYVCISQVKKGEERCFNLRFLLHFSLRKKGKKGREYANY